ncbi:thioesterase II family protein [Streptomyces similanensis]|uniref:Alpha/beta fold hydrolase n=1 Tax=Streptomyces similanensis TaxID=1274988 RepID=A0ABP9LKY8_9ACTN
MAQPAGPLDSPWTRRYASAPDASVRLVCLPHAGGSAPFYNELAKALSPDVEVVAVQYPGRLERWRDPLMENLAELADVLTGELLPLTEGDFALFGHSLGTTVAFEVARRLQARGRTPVHLFASGRGAPSRHRREFATRPDDRTLLQLMRGLGGTDPRVLEDEELMRLALPVLRADYTLLDSYRYVPGPPLDCPVTALNGKEDHKVTPADAEAWREHTTGSFDSLVFPGGHFYLVDQRAEVTGTITARLADSRDRHGH